MAKNDNTLLIVGGAVLAYLILSKKTTTVATPITQVQGQTLTPVSNSNLLITANTALSNLLKAFTPAPVSRDTTLLTAIDPTQSEIQSLSPSTDYFNNLLQQDNMPTIDNTDIQTFDITATDENTA